jgi:hypothetical protein
MTDDKVGGKIRKPKGWASVDDTEWFLTAMHLSPAPETRRSPRCRHDRRHTRSRPDRGEHGLPSYLIAKHSYWLQVVS